VIAAMQGRALCGGAATNPGGDPVAAALPMAGGEGGMPATVLEDFAASLDAAMPVAEAGVPAADAAVDTELADMLADLLAIPAAPLPPAPVADGLPALPLASLDHKDAVTRALRAQLFPAEAPSPAKAPPLPIPPNAAVAAAVPGHDAAAHMAGAATLPPLAAPAPYPPAAARPMAQAGTDANPSPAPSAPAGEAHGAGVALAGIAAAAPPPAPVPAANPPVPLAGMVQAAPHEAGRASHEALLGLLGARIQAQLRQGVQQAVIQLEPYLAGTVQLELRHEAGALRVHLSASHDDVVRQLQGIGDSLRQDLGGRHFTEVSVQVAQQRHADPQGQGRHAREDAPQPAVPGRALGESDEAYTRFAAALRRVSTTGA